MPAPLSYKNDTDADNRLNPAELRRAETKRRFNDIMDNYDQDADDSQENANIAKAKEREQAANGFKVDTDSIKRAASKAKKQIAAPAGNIGKLQAVLKSPNTAGIAGGGIVAAIMGIMVFLPMTGTLIALDANTTEAYGNAQRVQGMRFDHMMRYMVGNDGVSKACDKSVTSVRCKWGTMSDKQKKLYENGKFKVDGKEVGGRWIVTSITAPDGTVMRNGDSVVSNMRKNNHIARSLTRVHNVRSLVTNGGRMLRSVLAPAGLNKLPITETAPKEKAGKTSFVRKLFGLTESGTVDAEKTKLKVSGRATRASVKIKAGNVAAAVPAVGCAVYSTMKMTVNIAKLERIAFAVGVMMPFLKLASQMKDPSTSPAPETVSTLMDQLTARNADGESAMDAPALKEMFGVAGGSIALTVQAFLLQNNTVLRTADDIIRQTDEAIMGVGGYASTRQVCRLINSNAAFVAGGAMCGALAVVGAGAGSVVPGAGTLAGAAGGIASCAAAILGSLALGEVVGQIVQQAVIPWAVGAATEGLSGDTLIGPELGAVLGIGGAVLLNRVNRSNGLVPLKGSAVTAFNQATKETDDLYRQVEIAEARETPFDVTNRYSFFGSIAYAMNTQVFDITARTTSGNFAFQRLFSSFSLVPSALAAGETPAVITADKLRNCVSNPDAVAMGIKCTQSNQQVYGMSSGALALGYDENISYMETNKYVDEDGTPTPGSNYEKFITYCTNEEELGITTEPLDSDDYEWASKEKCMPIQEATTGNDKNWNIMLNHFQAYTSNAAANEDSNMNEMVSGGGLTVGTYNVLGYYHGEGSSFNPERLQQIVTNINTMGADVVGLQEYRDQRSGEAKAVEVELQKLNPAYRMSYQNDGDQLNFIYNSSSVTLLEDRPLQAIPARSSGCDGGTTYVRIGIFQTVAGQEFMVINGHPNSSHGPARCDADRLNTVKNTLADPAVASYTGPVIFLGDFNARPDSPSSRNYDPGPENYFKANGFANARDVPNKVHNQGGNIDHIYYKTSSISAPSYFEAMECGKLPEGDPTLFTSRYSCASDHVPLKAVFGVAANADLLSASRGSCPAGTTKVNGITEGWERNGQKKAITLCAIPGTRVIDSSATPHWRNPLYKGTTAAGIRQIAVNSDIAADALRMAQQARSGGHTLTATIGYRSLYEQCSIVIKRHSRPSVCPTWVTPVTGNWSSNATYSNHMMGYSIDFHGSSVDWMKKNGEEFGFIDDVYRAEGWDQAHFTNKP